MEELLNRYPTLRVCETEIKKATELLIDMYKSGNKLLLCGNGGSCADCEHIVGELMKGFLSTRPLNEKQRDDMKAKNPKLTDEVLSQLQMSLPAVSLTSFSGLNTAFCNDVNPELMYAQSVMGLGKSGDILLCISTSGNSKNCVAAANVAKGLGLTVIAMTGKNGGKLRETADVLIAVPETETYKVQELHLPIYHSLCYSVERHFFAEN